VPYGVFKARIKEIVDIVHARCYMDDAEVSNLVPDLPDHPSSGERLRQW